MSLDEIGLKYNSDKSSKFHNYLNIYEKFFLNKRFLKNNILEIGVLNGDSLKILSEYFTNSQITGIDIIDKSHLNIKNCKTLIGDQSDRSFLNSINDYFDIIIDDGSHKMEHQQLTIGILFKRLKSGGVYILEDLHTSLPNYTETIVHGKQLFGLNESNDNNTLDFLTSLKKINLKNYYLHTEELNYLRENINSLEIFETSYRNENNKSLTSVIIKK